MFERLTDELLDLSVEVMGRREGAFAFLITCCCSSCSCGARAGGGN